MELDLMGYEVKELLTPLRIRRHEANVDRMASGHTSAILCNDPISSFPLSGLQRFVIIPFNLLGINQAVFLYLNSLYIIFTGAECR